MTHNNTTTSVVPGVVPSVVPRGATPEVRTGVVPWSLSYGGTSPDRPMWMDHTPVTPSVVPTPHEHVSSGPR